MIDRGLISSVLLGDSLPDALSDGDNATCMSTTVGGELYRKLVEFPASLVDQSVVATTVVGQHLQCDDGLKFYVNTGAEANADMYQLVNGLKRCDLILADSTQCQFECQCPVQAGGCQLGLMHWNQRQVAPQAPQICEVLFA